MIDLTSYGDDALSLRVMNDAYFHSEIDPKDHRYLVALCYEEFDFTEKQLEVLIEDIRCKAPLFLARQLMKHKAGFTWNEESRRYTES